MVGCQSRVIDINFEIDIEIDIKVDIEIEIEVNRSGGMCTGVNSIVVVIDYAVGFYVS